MQRCYEKSDRLKKLYEDGNPLGEVIEKLCVGLLATRGLLIVYEQNAVLAHVNRLIEPWVEIVDVKAEMNRSKGQHARKKIAAT